jgi:hypothetical protein
LQCTSHRPFSRENGRIHGHASWRASCISSRVISRRSRASVTGTSGNKVAGHQQGHRIEPRRVSGGSRIVLGNHRQALYRVPIPCKHGVNIVSWPRHRCRRHRQARAFKIEFEIASGMGRLVIGIASRACRSIASYRTVNRYLSYPCRTN